VLRNYLKAMARRPEVMGPLPALRKASALFPGLDRRISRHRQCNRARALPQVGASGVVEAQSCERSVGITEAGVRRDTRPILYLGFWESDSVFLKVCVTTKKGSSILAPRRLTSASRSSALLA
jgi:hypothetical protein